MKERGGRHRHLLTAVDTALACILVLFALQVWLLTASVEAALGGEEGIALPALVVSLGCFLLNAGLLRYILGLDRRQL